MVGASGLIRSLRTRNWPGSEGGSDDLSEASNDNETTLALSRSTRATRKGRKPDHAGGGPAVAVKPALPSPEAPLASWSINACKELFQPGLNAGMRSERSS